MTPEEALEFVRAAALELPEVGERPSHGAPTFFIRNKTSFVMFHDDHHGDGRLAIWCAAPAGVQTLMVEEDPVRFFVPAYVGHRGWLGVRLDVDADPDHVARIIEDAYRSVAPKRLVALLDDQTR
ncbi:MAG: MmcQ/YjbR family DNA-binding protein [Actinomycetota bacterium]|nr:MmcQ/YjbR family DNA-binding protein [Actinomycetota bacterium]